MNSFELYVKAGNLSEICVSIAKGLGVQPRGRRDEHGIRVFAEVRVLDAYSVACPYSKNHPVHTESKFKWANYMIQTKVTRIKGILFNQPLFLLRRLFLL